MSIEVTLFSHLSNQTELNALIDGRIYPLLMPQDSAMPAVIYTVVNNRELQSINYREAYGFDIRIQIDCYSKSFSEVLSVKEAVRSAMHEFKYKAHDFNSRTLYEPEAKLHRQLIEFYIKG